MAIDKGDGFMTTILHTVAGKIGRLFIRFSHRHYALAYISVFLGMPALILAAVALAAVIMYFPILWMFS